MLGYYEGYKNGPARPVTNPDWRTVFCNGCGIWQTHHRESGGWRCVICSDRMEDKIND